MAESKAKISAPPNDRPIGQISAGTGPGTPDDALAPGEECSSPPIDEEAERLAKTLGVRSKQDALPLDGE